jgi:mannose-6-phosphate isomerase-like protein (cupin superfamily)
VTQYVFDARDVIRYRFPTHTNDLIMDRRDASASEAFFVVLEPGEAPPIHVHDDAEQVFFILEGEGELGVGPDAGEKHPLKVGDFVRTPPGVAHSVRCTGASRLVYLSIDCFTAGPPSEEPSWDSHVHTMCETNGWDFDAVRLGSAPSGNPAFRGR